MSVQKLLRRKSAVSTAEEFSGLRLGEESTIVLTPEATRIVQAVGPAVVKEAVNATLREAWENPDGAQSIDQRNAHARSGRTVHRMNDAYEARLGMPLALKGTGRDMRPNGESLWQQFRHMQQLSARQQDKYPGGILGSIFFNKPFGYIQQQPQNGGPLREWLLMDRVVDSHRVTVRTVPPQLVHGRIALEARSGFSPQEYPALGYLASLDSKNPPSGTPVLEQLVRPLANILGVPEVELVDMPGNLLVQGHPANQRITIIDMYDRSRR